MREYLFGISYGLRTLRSLWRPAFLVILTVGLGVAIMFYSSATALMSNAERSSNGLGEFLPIFQNSVIDYSKFKHDNANHARLPCLLCHRRETDGPRPTLPGSKGHMPCAGCHAQQFANPSSPICSNCHTEPQSSNLKPFPRLSSFNMKFDHARHARLGTVSCVTCHRATRGGVAFTIPAGMNAHTTCYRCHTARAASAEKDISSCGVCHEPGRPVRTRETAPAFRVGFSHAKHDKSKGLTCNECHRVRSGVARGNQVTAPQPLNHHAFPGAFSCMSCHNGKKAFGGDDFSVCQRCHIRDTWHF